jgi:hypothetical protein
MISFIIVDKTGNLNECKVDKLENVYKKCGLRKSEDFKKVMVYNLKNENTIELWGRVVGRNNTKNPFSFKLDTTIKLYGPAAILCIKKDKLENLFIYDYTNLTEENAPDIAATSNAETTVTTTQNAASTITTNATITTKATTMNLKKIEEVLNETENSEESISDSELENEDYIYSSEEENN